MKYLIFLLLLLPCRGFAQFTSTQDGLTVIVTDGTYTGKKSPLNSPGNARFTDPIRPLGMAEAIQAGAFVERPEYGRVGFILIFCVNDAIGGQQGILFVNGEPYRGIYRLIRQKLAPKEPIPEGMTTYRLSGTVFFLGIS